MTMRITGEARSTSRQWNNHSKETNIHRATVKKNTKKKAFGGLFVKARSVGVCQPYRSIQGQEHSFAHACLHMVSLTVLDSLHDRKSGFVGDPTNAAQPAQTSESFQSLNMHISQNELHSLKENTTTPPMQESASAEQPVLRKTRVS